MTQLVFFIFLVVIICASMVMAAEEQNSIKPPFFKKAENARWLAHTNVWGTISTTSIHLNGQAWGAATSFVDGTTTNSTGNIYMYKSGMDTSVQDFTANPNVAFSVSMAERGLCTVDRLDPEDPRCARATFSGKIQKVTDPDELSFATEALFERHPGMQSWPTDHDWTVYKIDFQEIYLIDIYGGSSTISNEDYFAVKI